MHTPVPVLQLPATWQASEAAHTTGFPPVHVPDWHVSVCVQAFPSEQLVPFGDAASLGHAAAFPGQCSIASHTPAAARQTTDVAAKVFVGHAFEEPLQVSCKSQTPADARQTVPAAATASAGHVVLAPVHVS